MRVLLLSHSAARTGAPLSVLRAYEWLVANDHVEVVTALREGGPLTDRFGRLGPVHTHIAARHRRLGKAAQRIRLGSLATAWQTRQSKFVADQIGGVDVVHANTLASGGLLAELVSPDVPAVVHVHELCGVARNDLVACEVDYSLTRGDQFIAPASSVRDFLVSEGVAPDRIRIVRECIETPRDVPLAAPASGRAACVGGSGQLHPRKGPDLFLGVVSRLQTATDAEVVPTWIGGNMQGQHGGALAAQARAAGFDPDAIFIGIVDDAERRYGALDVFLLTSREDPYPLVMLEAAAQGTPVVAFQGSGGASEFLDGVPGALVPFEDVEAMSAATAAYLQDDALRSRASAMIRQRALAHLPPAIGMQLLEVLARATVAGVTR